MRRSRPPLRRLARVATALLAVALSTGLDAPRPAHAADGAGDLASVPDVRGRSRADATATLGAEGFLVGVYEIAGDPVDTVAAQSPSPATALPRGGIVILDVRRKEADPTPAPNAVGLTTAAAVSAFGRLYDVRFVAQAGPAAERGKVLAQTPAPGQPLALKGTLTLRYVVDLTLPPTVPTPDVSGLSATQAIDALAAAGLHARIVETAIPGAPVDLAIGQQPLPGSEVPRESPVRVVVTIAVEGGDAPELGSPIVPNVTGLAESAARAALDESGFDAAVDYVAGDPSQAFLVVEQSPEAGTEAPPGSPVRIQVVGSGAPTSGPAGAAMPNLLGLTAWQAEDVLASIGLRAYPILVDNPGYPEMRVFAQQTSPGTNVPLGSSVSYRVARPKPPDASVVVPDLYGRTAGGSIALAAQAGLSLTIVEIQTPVHPAWRVFSQSISAYSTVPPGTSVIARIAKPTPGGASVEIPDLLGRTASQAASVLAASGLSAGVIEVYAPGKPPLKVFDQHPDAGQHVPAGSLVQVKVAKLQLGWKAVPPLGGLTKAQAVAAVLAAGLQPDADDVIAFGKPPGKVFAQAPPPGTLKPAGATVSFKVAKAALVPVPLVVGLSQAQALASLAASGLSGNVDVVFAPAKPAGKVFDQNPNAGALVGSGSSILVRIASGALPPAMATVPNLFGKTKAQAISILASFGFAADPDEIVAPGKPPGLVFSQTPIAGTGASAGTLVHVKVAKAGIPVVAVPNLIGLTSGQAQAALLAKGLGSNGKIELKLGKPIHRVYSQFTSPGIFVPKGTVITWKANP